MTEMPLTPSRLAELPEGTREFLAGLRPDELQTLKAVIELPAEDVRDGFKMVRDLRAVGRFTRAAIITLVGLFIAAVTFYENVLKVATFLRGGKS